MDKIELNATVIGGGIIGLLIAYEIKLNYPEWDVVLLEAAPFLGDHSTGRNSGVLHAGLYYPTNSHKHLLCMEGMDLWKQDLCPNLNINFKECGKILFAKDETESAGLEDIWDRAHQNGVKDLAWLDARKLAEANKFVTAKKAFFSPRTGILDVSGAVKKIADAFEALGGMIAKNCHVLDINKDVSFHITTNDFHINSDFVINAAGFHGPEIRKKLGLFDLKSYLVKGNYISTSQNLNHPCLFYPVPPKNLKGLGVHSTLDLQDKIKFGPNIEDVSEINYADSKLALEVMKPEILATFKGIDSSKLYWDYCGIRSKLFNIQLDCLESDFWIKSPIKNYVECLGIESPGLTSAPAIAKKVFKDFINQL